MTEILKKKGLGYIKLLLTGIPKTAFIEEVIQKVFQQKSFIRAFIKFVSNQVIPELKRTSGFKKTNSLGTTFS